MKNIIFLFAFFSAGTILGQNYEQHRISELKKLYPKKVLYQKFKNSNVRKHLNIKLTDFNYNEILEQYSNLNQDNKHLLDIPILNDIEDENLLNHISSNYSLYQRFLIYSKQPEKNKTNLTHYGCDDCNYVLYLPLKELKKNLQETY